jgi:hypothetical protein
MNYNIRAVGWKNGGPGVLPCAVEAKPAPTFKRGHFLKLLSIFYCFFIGLRGLSAEVRFGIGAFCFKTKDTNYICQRQKPNFHEITNFSCAWWYPPSILSFQSAHSRGGLTFFCSKKGPSRGGTTRPWGPLKNNKQKRINATAAPAAMKGSARAGVVIAAPVNA